MHFTKLKSLKSKFFKNRSSSKRQRRLRNRKIFKRRLFRKLKNLLIKTFSSTKTKSKSFNKEFRFRSIRLNKCKMKRTCSHKKFINFNFMKTRSMILSS